ncbi:MAG TPA: SigB/SigF/SigG family RNA polymerase sigma factor [Bacillota bacterium]|nr:SigB/SigF/SigG family RNA polymerase sigma factor [Bacillota bacterium]
MLSSPAAVNNDLNLAQNALLSDSQFLELVKLSKIGSTDAKETLVKHNLRLVMSIAQRFAGRGELDDLFQIGCMGLIKAVERFEPEYGVKFSTYAVPLIIGEIKQHLRDSGPMKISRSVKETACRVEQSRMSLLSELGREPTLAELVNVTGLPREEIAGALEAAQPVASIHEIVGDDEGEGVSREQFIGDDSDHSQWLEQYALQEGLAQLPERLKLLIELRFFQEKTQSEVAKLLGVSQVQVCRLEKSALDQLRKFYQSDP